MAYETSGTLEIPRQSPSDETISVDDWSNVFFSNIIEEDGVVKFDTIPTIPGSTLIHWPMDGGSGSTLTDNEGSSDGTINGATWTSGTWVGNQALDFNRSESVETPYISEFDTQTFSVLITVEPQTLAESRIWDYFASGSYGHLLNLTSDGGVRFTIADSASSGDFQYDSTTILSTGTKYRIALTYDNRNLKMYINGSLDVDTTTDDDIELTNGGLDWWLGANQQGGDALDGILDDFIYCTSAISETEIQDDLDRQPWYSSGETTPRLSGQPVTTNTILVDN